jgi:hypothetical protein
MRPAFHLNRLPLCSRYSYVQYRHANVASPSSFRLLRSLDQFYITNPDKADNSLERVSWKRHKALKLEVASRRLVHKLFVVPSVPCSQIARLQTTLSTLPCLVATMEIYTFVIIYLLEIIRGDSLPTQKSAKKDTARCDASIDSISCPLQLVTSNWQISPKLPFTIEWQHNEGSVTINLLRDAVGSWEIVQVLNSK